MNIKIGILNVPKHCNKHDLIHFVTVPNFDRKLLKNSKMPAPTFWFSGDELSR